jgi:hypothetical protein
VLLNVAAIFYRIVHGDIPTADDFRTDKELGKPLFNPVYEREWAEGISVYKSRDFALKRARHNKSELGRFVAPLLLPEDSGVKVRQTTKDRRHYTLYASGELALAFVCGPTIYALEQDDA